MSFKIRLYGITFLIVFLLLLFVYLNGLEADELETRPRYTLVDTRISFLFFNTSELPFALIREMCWNNTDGFCDSNLEGAEEIYILIDWQTMAYGAVFETDSGACFWWNYQSEFGSDNNPHIHEHYWIECPTISLN